MKSSEFPRPVCFRFWVSIVLGSVQLFVPPQLFSCRSVRSWPQLARALPQRRRDRQRIEVELLPPFFLIAVPMELAMMGPADGHGKFVAHLPTERARLRVGEVMGVGGFTS